MNSTGLAAAPSPVLDHERAVTIAGEAPESGERVYDLILRNGWLAQQELDELLRPGNMIQPDQPMSALVSHRRTDA
ncbi:hypothetical protein [Lentzea aerocolonigenes]|uniref:hypothetical protein n=1 Tax=Lentzea aerocolonigenes TaxID=68170 RepID=UPI0004C453E4|nr:hypothetical protein [Lentzea aerocolonigenes]MCP2242341.1 Fumarase C C-terminus [Lentzea aerocolonigenes]